MKKFKKGQKVRVVKPCSSSEHTKGFEGYVIDVTFDRLIPFESSTIYLVSSSLDCDCGRSFNCTHNTWWEHRSGLELIEEQ